MPGTFSSPYQISNAMNAKLTQKQQSALRFIALGMNQTQAGRKAGYAINNAPQMVNKLLKRKDAQEFLASVNEQVETLGGKEILSVTARKQHLSDIVTSNLSTPNEQMNAIDLLCKIEGIYITKVQAEVKVAAGVLLVPMAMNLEQWEAGAGEAQAKLMAEAIGEE